MMLNSNTHLVEGTFYDLLTDDDVRTCVRKKDFYCHIQSYHLRKGRAPCLDEIHVSAEMFKVVGEESVRCLKILHVVYCSWREETIHAEWRKQLYIRKYGSTVVLLT